MSHLLRRAALLLVLSAVALSAGCIYESLGTIVTADKLVFYENLVGEYECKSGEHKLGHFTIAKGKEDKSYLVTERNADGGIVGTRVLRLIKLGEHHFYDMEMPAETNKGKIHGFGRMAIDGDRIRAFIFDGDDMDGKKLYGHGDIRTEEYVRIGPDGTQTMRRAVSMTPQDLQAFLQKHAGEMTREAYVLTRVGKAE